MFVWLLTIPPAAVHSALGTKVRSPEVPIGMNVFPACALATNRTLRTVRKQIGKKTATSKTGAEEQAQLWFPHSKRTWNNCKSFRVVQKNS